MRKLLLALFVLWSLPAFAEEASVYDRVMKSGTLRCGYITGAPYIMKDTATGAITGIWHDYVEDMAKLLGWKVDWAAEVGYGEFATALESNKVDAICIGFWINPSRAKVMDFVSPITYQVMHAYVKEGDSRFDNNLGKIDDPKIRVSCVDGEMSSMIAQEDFPKASQTCMPQSTPFSDLFMNIITNKADVVFSSPAAVNTFNKNNTTKLRRVPAAYPVRLFPESIAIARNQYEFRRVLDLTTEFMVSTGKIDKILAKYQTSPVDFQHPAKPYEVSK